MQLRLVRRWSEPPSSVFITFAVFYDKALSLFACSLSVWLAFSAWPIARSRARVPSISLLHDGAISLTPPHPHTLFLYLVLAHY